MPRLSMAEKAARNITVRPNSQVMQRNAVLKNMNPALLGKVNEVEQLLVDSNRNSILFHHRLGTIVKDVQQHPKRYGGDTAMELLEKALPNRRDLIRRAVQFAIETTKAEAEKFADMQNTDAGFCLNWGHMIVLLTVKDKEKRLQYAKRAIAELLDPKALHQIIQKKQGKTGGGGRPHKLPATIAAQLRQIMNKTTDWVSKHETIWQGPDDSAITNLLDCPPNEVDVMMLDHAKATKEALQRMADLANKDVATFDRIIDRLEGCLRGEK